MQDRYVGDVGDFAKFGLLRAISKGKRLGVAWYLHPNAGPAGDGQHTEYLTRDKEFRHLDEELFDVLKQLRNRNELSVEAVKKSGILGRAVFAEDPLKTAEIEVKDRTAWQHQWFVRVQDQLSGCELVFADPDNGLFPDDRFKPTRKESARRIPLKEAMALAEERPAVFYHHNTRFPGGHHQEIRNWMSRLPGCSHAFYWRRWSNRTFFIVNADEEMRRRLENFAKRWSRCGKLLEAKNPVIEPESAPVHLL